MLEKSKLSPFYFRKTDWSKTDHLILCKSQPEYMYQMKPRVLIVTKKNRPYQHVIIREAWEGTSPSLIPAISLFTSIPPFYFPNGSPCLIPLLPLLSIHWLVSPNSSPGHADCKHQDSKPHLENCSLLVYRHPETPASTGLTHSLTHKSSPL